MGPRQDLSPEISFLMSTGQFTARLRLRAGAVQARRAPDGLEADGRCSSRRRRRGRRRRRHRNARSARATAGGGFRQRRQPADARQQRYCRRVPASGRPRSNARVSVLGGTLRHREGGLSLHRRVGAHMHAGEMCRHEIVMRVCVRQRGHWRRERHHEPDSKRDTSREHGTRHYGEVKGCRGSTQRHVRNCTAIHPARGRRR